MKALIITILIGLLSAACSDMSRQGITNTTMSEQEIQEKIKNTRWTLDNLEQDGSLPINLGVTTLSFSNENTFVADFCHNIKGSYTVKANGRLKLSDFKKNDNNKCTEKTDSPIGTNLPNISIAEDILLLGTFDIRIDGKNLFLSNEKGKLMFKLFDIKNFH